MNILLLRAFNTFLPKPLLEPAKCHLSAYNGTDIPVKGSCKLKVGYNGHTFPVSFLVANIDSQLKVGLDTSTELNLIKRVCAVDSNLRQYLNECHEGFRK